MPPVGYKSHVIAAMPGTVPEITARSGLTESTVKRWIFIMRAAGESHIGSWKRSEGPGGFQSIHVAGPGADAVCKLKRRTCAQYSKRSRKAAKADGRMEIAQARRSAKYYANKAATQPHDWTAALFIGKSTNSKGGKNA